MSDLSHYEQEQMTNSLKRSNSILKNKLDLERQRSKVLVEGLTIIRDLPHPQFNGERVWTLSDISNATKVASNYLKKYEEMK